MTFGSRVTSAPATVSGSRRRVAHRHAARMWASLGRTRISTRPRKLGGRWCVEPAVVLEADRAHDRNPRRRTRSVGTARGRPDGAAPDRRRSSRRRRRRCPHSSGASQFVGVASFASTIHHGPDSRDRPGMGGFGREHAASAIAASSRRAEDSVGSAPVRAASPGPRGPRRVRRDDARAASPRLQSRAARPGGRIRPVSEDVDDGRPPARDDGAAASRRRCSPGVEDVSHGPAAHGCGP
jgi:hypothetical protein